MRYLACKAAGVSPHYAETWVAGDGSVVAALNQVRRELTKSQRAAVAMMIKEGVDL